ncbi:hypothetical protein DUI87_01824 [Hirundo rustica rustica]|uniref:RNA-directed DNA polymerase n=1 Tax=Hirundo rustica rustica TaxID=333673 RepID=A0A3M0LD58_HIRRU|nr:hypothetical protein DUI87_01824 [Hirundo rustica rustica]
MVVIGAKGEPFKVPIVKNVEIESENKICLEDMLLVEEADYNLLGRDLIVALGTNLIVRNSQIMVSIYKLTCEDEDKINPKVWHTGKEAGKLVMEPISIEIERPEDPIRIRQYPIPLEGRRGLKPIIEDLIRKGILEPFHAFFENICDLDRLQLTGGLHLKDDDWKLVSVDNSEQGTWPRVEGFELQEDKVQRMPPWRYLGLEIGKRTIVLQKLEIKAKIKTLADVHQLCGALNWVRPWLGLTTEDLAPLFNLLKGGEELSSPRELTPEAKNALEKVQHLMSTQQAHWCDPDLPFKFIIMGKLPHLHGVIFQWRNNIKKDQGREDLLLIIEWVFLSHQRSKRMTRPQELVAELIRKARVWIRELAGFDFECIHIPIGLRSGQITKAMLEHLLQENEALQFALDSFTGQISIHRPAHGIFNQDAKFTLNLKSVRSRKPLEALTVFTDTSGRSHREQPFFVMHTKSHTDLPGFIAEGNRRADALAAPAVMAPLPSIFEQAKLSHQLHHQNAPGLVRRFHITREQAKAIVATCPSCNQHALPTLSAGVSPRGLKSCELWQTDVTHIPQFGRSKYVHVSVDTFSGTVFASAHTGEKTSDVIKHLIQAFSFMGIPRELKTDNGPAYRSREFSSFLQQWGVGHKTGIPHSPTGQAVVERTQREIKRVLNQQQPVLKTENTTDLIGQGSIHPEFFKLHL